MELYSSAVDNSLGAATRSPNLKDSRKLALPWNLERAPGDLRAAPEIELCISYTITGRADLLLAPQLDQPVRRGYSLYLKERKSLSVLLVLVSSVMMSVAGELERATEGSYRDSRAGVGVTFLFSPTKPTDLRYFPRRFSYRYW